MLDLTYVLPLRASEPQLQLTPYLQSIAALCEVIVVDGSDDPDVFDAHERAFSAAGARHLPVDPARATLMGKVGGVMTGVDAATNDKIVIADDDVSYTEAQLVEVARRLDDVDLVRPQNYFDPLPWHAWWDTPRLLIGRATGGDWPGTMAVRRGTLLRAGGYAGDVMFENLELERTVAAVGGRTAVAHGLLVRREPPPTRQFLDQRVRQAYDELARPTRLLVSLAVLPAIGLGRWRAGLAIAGLSIALAEAGRRRDGGREVFPATAALLAPCWVAERSVTSWLAVWSRIRHGGIRYRGSVIRRAATPSRELRERLAGARQETATGFTR